MAKVDDLLPRYASENLQVQSTYELIRDYPGVGSRGDCITILGFRTVGSLHFEITFFSTRYGAKVLVFWYWGSHDQTLMEHLKLLS